MKKGYIIFVIAVLVAIGVYVFYVRADWLPDAQYKVGTQTPRSVSTEGEVQTQ